MLEKDLEFLRKLIEGDKLIDSYNPPFTHEKNIPDIEGDHIDWMRIERHNVTWMTILRINSEINGPMVSLKGDSLKYNAMKISLFLKDN